MTDTKTNPTTWDLKDEDAHMLAAHAIHVQGGYSTPDIERERFLSDVARGGFADPQEVLDRMREEVKAEMRKRIAALPEPEPAAAAPAPAPAAEPVKQDIFCDVSAVANHIDATIALRKRIKDLEKVKAEHETAIKDLMKEATVGKIGDEVVVKWPVRNRTNLVKAKVKAILTAAQFAECETVTQYRALEFTKE